MISYGVRALVLFGLLIGRIGVAQAGEWVTENSGGPMDGESLIISVDAEGSSAAAIGVKKDMQGNYSPVVFSLWENPWEPGDASWEPIGGNAPGEMILVTIRYATEDVAFIGGGFNGGIFRSEDGGENWAKMAGFTLGNSIAGFVFSEDRQTVIAVTSGGKTKTSTDGGLTFGEMVKWTLPAGSNLQISSVTQVGEVVFLFGGDSGDAGDEFTDPRPAGSGFVMRSMDLGVTWETMASGLPYQVGGGSFIDSEVGMIVGGSEGARAVIGLTEDGGASFESLPVQDFPKEECFKPVMVGTTPAVCLDVIMFNEDDAVALCSTASDPDQQGNELIVRTSDGGGTWSVYGGFMDSLGNPSQMLVDMTAMDFPKCGRGYVVGSYLMIRSYTGDEVCDAPGTGDGEDGDGDGDADGATNERDEGTSSCAMVAARDRGSWLSALANLF